MSKPRTFLSFTTVCSAAFLAARLAVWMFPMQAPAQSPRAVERVSTVADGPGVVVEPGAKILHRSPVFFPSGVTTAGTVVVESSVNAKGEVTDAHVLSGPDELRNAALSSVLTWHFSTDGGLPPTVQSVIRFQTAPHSAPVVTVSATPSMARPGLYLKSINMSGLSDELAEKVRASLPVRVGDAIGNNEFAQVRAAIEEVDEHLIFGIKVNPPDVTLTIMLAGVGTTKATVNWMTSGVVGGVSGGPTFRIVGGTPDRLTEELAATRSYVSATTTNSQLPAPADGVQRVRVGGNVESVNLTRKVTPLYPPLAKQARIQGTVRFTALIGADGSVISLQLVEGHPLLVESAREAVQQWQYKPTLLNGNAVEVITQIDVNYTLSQ
jgi:TonB family protein